jgi:hypothetical protein
MHAVTNLERPVLPYWALCQVREFVQGGLEGICSSVSHYPGEQRVVGRQVAQAGDVSLDSGRDDLGKGARRASPAVLDQEQLQPTRSTHREDPQLPQGS